MDTRKVTLVATIAVIALVAVGIGYAYTAMTTNSGNNVDTEYVTLVQGGDGEYQFAANEKVYWNTNDRRTVEAQSYTYCTDFALTGVTEILKGHTVVKVGDSFDIKTKVTGNTPAANTKITFDATGVAAPFSGTTGSTVLIIKIHASGDQESNDQYLKLTAANTFHMYSGDTLDTEVTQYPQTQVTIEDNTFLIQPDGTQGHENEYKTVTITFYYGYLGTTGVSVTHAQGEQPTTGPSAAPLDNAGFVFKYSTDEQNGTGTPVTGIALSKYTSAIVGTGTDTVTVTFTPASPTNTNVIVTSSNTGVATVEYTLNSKTITITGVAAGNATITVVAEGGYTQTITVTVTAS